jgi:hypothetical protein
MHDSKNAVNASQRMTLQKQSATRGIAKRHELVKPGSR